MVGPNSAHASLNTGLALHMLLSFRWLFPFFCLCLPSGMLRRFLYPTLDPLAFVPNTFYMHNLSKYGPYTQPYSIWRFPKPRFTHMLWFELKPMFLHQNQCLLRHKELFYTKTVLYTNTMFYTKTMFLLGLCKGCLQLFPWWPAENAEGA